MKILNLSNMDLEITMKMNCIADEIARPYAEFVDEISEKHKNDIFWWMTPFASRNMNLSTAFKDISILYTALFYLEENDDIEEVIVHKYSIALALNNYLVEKSKYVKVTVDKREGNSVKNRKKENLRIIYKFLLQVRYKYIQFIKTKKLAQYVKIDMSQKFHLIDLYAYSSCFAEGEYRDRCFTDILKHTKEKLLFCPTLIYNTKMSQEEFVNNLIQSKEQKFIIKEKYVTRREFFTILQYPMKCIKYTEGIKKFQEIDVTEIINEDLKNSLMEGNIIEGNINYYFIKNLAKETNKITSLIGWYEAQPSSLLIFKSFHTYFPKTYTIGYAGYPLISNNYSICSSKLQVTESVTPKVIGVIGKAYKEYLMKWNRNQKVKVLPALRMNEIYESSSFITEEKRKTFRVFVALSYFYEENRKILGMIFEDLISNTRTIEVIIKNHPIYSEYQLSDYGISRGVLKAKFVVDTVVECAQKSDLAIVGAGTTAALEILSQGIPVIIVENLGQLSTCKLTKTIAGEYCKLVYTQKDYEEALLYYETEYKNQIENLNTVALKTKILKEAFTPTNIDSVACFFSDIGKKL